MTGNDHTSAPEGYQPPSAAGYPPPPPGGYVPPGPQYAAPPPPVAPRKGSVGKRIGAALGAVVLVIAAKFGLHAVTHRHADRPLISDGFDYAVGT